MFIYRSLSPLCNRRKIYRRKKVQLQILFLPPIFLGCTAGVLFEVAAEEGEVGEVVVPGDLFDGILGVAELELQLKNDVMVDDDF